jgi:ribosome maturation factor RimP
MEWALRPFFVGLKNCWLVDFLSMNAKEKQIESLLAPTVEANGCAIWGVEWLSSGRHSKLCLYIDREAGVSVDDCERISRQVGDILDVEDVLPQRYTLEVSSPGMDRILFTPDQYASSVGERIDARLNFPFEGRKRIVGLLAGVEDGQAVVRVDDNEYLLPLENIQRGRIVPKFD